MGFQMIYLFKARVTSTASAGAYVLLREMFGSKAAIPDRAASPFHPRLYMKRGFLAIGYRYEEQGCFREGMQRVIYRFG